MVLGGAVNRQSQQPDGTGSLTALFASLTRVAQAVMFDSLAGCLIRQPYKYEEVPAKFSRSAFLSQPIIASSGECGRNVAAGSVLFALTNPRMLPDDGQGTPRRQKL